MPISDDDLSQIDLNLLVVFAALIETASVTRAAERLRSSQPAVSRSLARLRVLFDDPLLIKSGKTMVPTPRALALKGPVAAALGDIRRLFKPAGFDPVTDRRRFRVSSTDYGVLSVLAPVMAELTRTPNVEIAVDPLGADDHQKLASGVLDLIIIGRTPERPELYRRRLFTERRACLVRAGHPITADPDVIAGRPPSIDACLAWPHVAMTVFGDWTNGHIARQLRSLGKGRHVAIQLPYFSVAPLLVETSDALLILPHRAAKRFAEARGLVMFDAPEVFGTFDYWLVWHERARRDPALHWLIERIAAAVGDPDAA
ncbi:LysR substrate-binding domain-containing protein [Tistrella bauzanensis]|uniref:LysR substrate-binding domain-containing protein n=1 Tax=Tistrella arctica TaxID=3133430 RepID=A0ABU9YJQ1_9PROT